MNRYLRFNLVGVLGMGVQLGMLSILHRVWPAHYLADTATAVEMAVMHNFFWHIRFTWQDSNKRKRAQQLIRFHLANGVISMAGNLAIMPLFVHGFHLPVLLANVLAILLCSLANFAASHRWAFEARRLATLGALCLCLLGQSALQAQDATAAAQGSQPSASSRGYSLPDAPIAAVSQPKRKLAGEYPNYYGGLFCGAGSTSTQNSQKPAFICGAGMDFVPLPIFIEFGVIGPQAAGSKVSGYMSLDTNIGLAPAKTAYFPMAMVGYSLLFQSGSALDYGLAIGLPGAVKPRKRQRHDNIRIELRDYWIVGNQDQHNIMLRIGWIEEIWD
jgi:putative flippase GtrA